ncbi:MULTISPECIES: DegQ family serine endoprotease [Shewanella]|uniref:DegQ family serine endoprotease n=1 Tax=Shewanella fidelis TaxID=173509 RepID=A0AAW8NHH4_9GAMM|nr:MULTISPECIES: DegQ family serine endoprotease [Shewanella]MDR8522322.1 DegQ family serine endoprotease [Shewanella fidelis]MDW4812462.1 DegQ family serine endoprotease [Shewanella fidelis]MDW4816209.1 DegQ family serine endoprotease [Shewanella fidelis]MDW4820703.1 DegQ family serine endoprotease [Shewanella fidelis]MDW4824925.1 DegQ family serine endoprotease [Shewanella fidelis]
MKTKLSILSAALLSATLTMAPAVSQAAIPLAVDGQELPSLAPMLQKTTPAVVAVAVSGTHVSKQKVPDAFRYFFGPNAPREQVQERPFKGLGSGVIIDAEEGYIVTNNHVIEGADEILIGLHDGREIEAKLIGADAESDIALLQIKAKNLTALKRADSDKLQVGDFAVAIGNPFGLGQTVTSGIVSAMGRSGLGIEMLENFIQTDAAINSGNSGGALVNLNGELIGINTAIVAPGGGNVGIGFAIPANMANNLVQQIIEHGEVRRGVLGVMGQDLTSELAKGFGIETQHGGFINEVMPDSAAEKAGIKVGDIIVSVNGRSIKSFQELRAKVATMGAGSEVEFGLIRDGDKETVTAVLGESTQAAEAAAGAVHPMLQGAKLESTKSGVEITEVAQGSPAAMSGLIKGDVIVGVNRTKVKNLKALKSALEDQKGTVALKIKRDSTSLYLILR